MKWLYRLALFLSISILTLVDCTSGATKDFRVKSTSTTSSSMRPISPAVVDPAPAQFVPSSQEQAFLNQLTQATWNYLHSPAAISNHMPHSWYSPTISGGDYANPAEIGFYALSRVAAYDLGRPWSPDWVTTENEVTAILNQLRVWQTDGLGNTYSGNGKRVFYQWYWIANSPPKVGDGDADRLVPSIDNAWLAASLITIREYAEANNHPALGQKADVILADMDFSLWYHADTRQFSWGDVESPQGGSLADYYSNENRIINFVARALGQLSPEEFKLSMDALVKPSGSYGGITVERMAWDGSYFTYAGPALFIREIETPYGQRVIFPATQAQIQYAADQQYAAWGLSDSFDTSGNYVQQGAPPVPAGMTAPIETVPGLITPHASALGLITPLAAQSVANLQHIMTTFPTCYDDSFGFRDSVIAKGGMEYGECSDRFSSLAQEWLFLSIVNHDSGFLWKYFYRDAGVAASHAEMYDSTWTLIWNDEFNGTGSVNPSNWLYDNGTGYPGGPSNWGTGEVQSYTNGTDNIFQSDGHLNIRALHTGVDPVTGWTSARIETTRADFQPPAGGVMAVEARIQLPVATGSDATGYWPAFWMLGAPFRGNYWNWPEVGEIDIMENVNGLNQWWGTFHCGINPDGQCHEPSGLGGSASDFTPGLQNAFHIYRVEFDQSLSPQEIRWFVDGVHQLTVRSDQVDGTTWENATNHGFFILLNIAMGGGWAGNPNASSVSGGTMLVDYVRVYYLGIPEVRAILRGSSNPTSALYANFTIVFSEPVSGVDKTDFALTMSGISGASVSGVSCAGVTCTVTVKVGTGNGTLQLSISPSATITDLGGNPLSDLPYTGGEVYTVKKILTFRSAGAQDGWILESGENTLQGGSMDGTGPTLRLGDNAARRQYRSILSFDTSSLPDNAVFTKVTLKVKRQAIVGGGNPITMFQGFMADIKRGIFGASALQAGDWQAVSQKTLGPFTNPLSGGWYTPDITAAKAYINKTLDTGGGLTQIRLRFKLDDNNNAIANYLSLYSGDAPLASRPQLIIEYYVP